MTFLMSALGISLLPVPGEDPNGKPHEVHDEARPEDQEQEVEGDHPLLGEGLAQADGPVRRGGGAVHPHAVRRPHRAPTVGLVPRAGYSGFLRNLAIALGNWLAGSETPDPEAVGVLVAALSDEGPVVAEPAAWGLGRIDRAGA